ncbi:MULTISPECIES: helix-turn-helix domain-containing protein [Streptomycetaceae]|uniref:helix-turn-helix domain-containing protein n=1 Tax=Streptomycetaceae TaxID=2062 RepID=UPI0034E1E1E4
MGRNIRRLRKERKMSSAALSRELRGRGIRLQDSQIRRMETGALHGQSTPAVTVDHLVAFAWILGVSTTDLLTPVDEGGRQ